MASQGVTEGTTADTRLAADQTRPSPARLALNSRSVRPWLWWLGWLAIWSAGTLADRLWLQLDQRLPAWDQADYLNSAVDHGRALGLLPGGGWGGWQALLDLSPKIPPLASLVNGSVIAISGDNPDQASWALALWQALLLAAVACWGRQLVSPGFGLLAAALTSLTPALMALRVNFSLDLPLVATVVPALWLLGRWLAPDPRGGRWSQAIAAALAVACAILVKQSALLVLLLPCLWAAARALGQRGRRAQLLLAIALVIGACLPWLRHNWITTISGTNRAVVESAATEGDPAPLSLASLVWYLRLCPRQIGLPILLPALAGGLLAAATRGSDRRGASRPDEARAWDWRWLIGCTIGGWLLTTLSPNKDPRYITPVLPLLVLLLARGWWELGLALSRRGWRRPAWVLLGAGLLGSTAAAATEQAGQLQRERRSPVPEVVGRVRQELGNQPGTLVVLPNAAELNEHTVTVYGRRGGGQLLGRQLGRRPGDRSLVLEQARWVLVTTEEAAHRRRYSRQLAGAIRSDPRFELAGAWPWADGEPVELWRRRQPPDPAGRFDPVFIRLAAGLERGPTALGAVFAAIGPQHQLDGHWLYQRRVTTWAEKRLQADPGDREALWSLGLLAVLRNRPAEAERWFGRLEQRLPDNPWPPAYRSVVLLAGWNPWRAYAVASAATQRHHEPVLEALADVSGALGPDPGRLVRAFRSVPAAARSVTEDLQRKPPAP